MTEERTVRIGENSYTITISDEREALLAAKAAGRAILALQTEESSGFLAPYGVERMEDLDQTFLERVVRRHLGLPWEIAETDRLLIREFQLQDAPFVPQERGDGPAERIFCTPKLLDSYIRCQYGFYEYGIWAVVEKGSGRLVGMAGVTDPDEGDWKGAELVPGAGESAVGAEELALGAAASAPRHALEIGYHIFEPYRRQGYAREAVEAVLRYAAEELGISVITAKTDASNEASVHILQSFGFQFIGKRCSESGRWLQLYVRN